MWLKDPANNNQPSVSLTLLVITFIVTLVTKILEMLGVLVSSEILNEVMYSFVALYLGRRFNFKGKTTEITSNSKEQ